MSATHSVVTNLNQMPGVQHVIMTLLAATGYKAEFIFTRVRGERTIQLQVKTRNNRSVVVSDETQSFDPRRADTCAGRHCTFGRLSSNQHLLDCIDGALPNAPGSSMKLTFILTDEGTLRLKLITRADAQAERQIHGKTFAMQRPRRRIHTPQPRPAHVA
jgi:hypothetical protein